MTTKRNIQGYAVRADQGKPIVWLASSPEIARDKLRIPVESWITTDFEKQGSPLMWAHKYDEPPIGRVTKLTKTKAGLVAETIFSTVTERARITEALVREGTISCCSVGFEILELKGDTVTRASLTELSVVPIGSDPNAVALARSAYRSISYRSTPTKSEEELITRLHAAVCGPDRLSDQLRTVSGKLTELERRASPENIKRMVETEVRKAYR